MARSVSFRNADDLYRQVSVQDVAQVLRRTGNDAEKKRLELKELVSSRYHDLIDSADAIVGMADSVGEFRGVIQDIKEGSQKLLDNRLDFVKLSKTLSNTQEEKTHEDISLQEAATSSSASGDFLSENDFVERAHALLLLPSLIWNAIDHDALWIATYLLLVSRGLEESMCTISEVEGTDATPFEMPSSFQFDDEVLSTLGALHQESTSCENMANEKRKAMAAYQRFPELLAQCQVIKSCQEQVMESAHQLLSKENLSMEKTSGALVALMVLDDSVQTQTDALELLLKSRAQRLRECINSETTTEEKLSKELQIQLEVVHQTIVDSSLLFGNAANGSEPIIQTLFKFNPQMCKIRFGRIQNGFEVGHGIPKRFVDAINTFLGDLQSDQHYKSLLYFDNPTKVDWEKESAYCDAALRKWLMEQQHAVTTSVPEQLGLLSSIRSLSALQADLQSKERSLKSQAVMEEWEIASSVANSKHEEGNELKTRQNQRKANILDKVLQSALRLTNDVQPALDESGSEEPELECRVFPFLFKEPLIYQISCLVDISFVQEQESWTSTLHGHLTSGFHPQFSSRLKVALSAEKSLAHQRVDQLVVNPKKQEAVVGALLSSIRPIRTGEHRLHLAYKIIEQIESSIAKVSLDACGEGTQIGSSITKVSLDGSGEGTTETSSNSMSQILQVVRSRCSTAVKGFVKEMSDAFSNSCEQFLEPDGDTAPISLERAVGLAMTQENILFISRICELIPQLPSLSADVISDAMALSREAEEAWAQQLVTPAARELQAALDRQDLTAPGSVWKELHPDWVSHREGEEEEAAAVDVPSAPSAHVSTFLFTLVAGVHCLDDAEGPSAKDSESLDQVRGSVREANLRLLSLVAEEAWSALQASFGRALETAEPTSEEAALQVVLDLKFALWLLSPRLGREEAARAFVEEVVTEHVDGVIWYLYEKALDQVLARQAAQSELLAGSFLAGNGRPGPPPGERAESKLAGPLAPIGHIPLLPMATKFKLPKLQKKARKGSSRGSELPSAKQNGQGESTNTNDSVDLKDKALNVMGSVGTNLLSQYSSWLQTSSSQS